MNSNFFASNFECLRKIFSIICVLFFLNAPLDSLSGDSKPNIIFIMVDDLGKDWISCYGADNIQTPNIDHLANDGIKFHNAWSMPQCTPTRATLLTGKYPWRTGWVNHWDVPRWGVGYFDWQLNPSFSQALKQSGYKNAIAGKWQINDFRVEPNAMQKHGFDEWCLWTGYETGVKASALRYWHPYINTKEGSRTYPGEFGPDVYNNFLVNFITENSDVPWCVYYPMALTHGPLVHTPNETRAEKTYPRFRAMIRYMDKLVGKIVKAVDDSGQAENTLIIFTTDNGSPGVLGTRDGIKPSGGKASRFEGGICQPFIARWSGVIRPNSETNELIDFSDLYPTFLELAGNQQPKDNKIDGHSFVGLLKGNKNYKSRKWILSMGYGPAVRDNRGVRGKLDYAPRVIRNKTYKVWVNSDRKIDKLYNLKNDPYEKFNLLEEGKLTKAEVNSIMKPFIEVVASMPIKDSRPKYRARKSNPWDKPINYKPGLY